MTKLKTYVTPTNALSIIYEP